MRTSIVIGLGFGDEGKGITTDYLCRQSRSPLVIRFSGGHQAGHTVVTESGQRHVFSSFGSGTLRGVPTYWSKYGTLYPLAFHNELNALQQKGIQPVIFVDALAMVTTPYDVFHNRHLEKTNAHGSCGVGFGATIERNEGPNKLYVQDLFYPTVLEQKLQAIGRYYEEKTNNEQLSSQLEKESAQFKQHVQSILPHIQLVQEKTFFQDIIKQDTYDHLIFEGSQGILLDMDHGFFPNVTRAHTTSRNAIEIIQRNALGKPEVYYVSRAYATRHGNGFLSNENLNLDITPNPDETNQYNPWQGPLRMAPLDVDRLNYAFQCDSNYSGDIPKHLIITCMDQLNGPIQATVDGVLFHFASTMELLSQLDLKARSLIESHSDCAKDMQVRKKVMKLLHS
jgi:adenylosuccinate synthase